MSQTQHADQLLPVADGRSTTRVAWRLLRARRGSLALTVAAFLVTGFAGIVPVLMIGRVVDVVRDDGTFAEVLAPVAVMLAAAVVAAVSTTVSTAALARTVAPALAEHVRNGRLAGIDRAHQVDIHDLAIEIEIGSFDAARLHDAGGIDQDIDAAERGDGIFHRPYRVVFPRHVTGQRQSRAADRLDPLHQAVEPVGPAGRCHYRGPRLGQCIGCRFTDSG